MRGENPRACRQRSSGSSGSIGSIDGIGSFPRLLYPEGEHLYQQFSSIAENSSAHRQSRWREAACSVLSVLLATVSARCVSVREGSDLGLEHEDAGCSRWADRAGGSHPSRRGGGLARCTGGGVASSAAAALRGAVQFRRGTLYGRKRRCRGAARARGGRLLARRGHVVRRVACLDTRSSPSPSPSPLSPA